MWHASIARLDFSKRRTLQMREWSSLVRGNAKKMCLQALEGVGGEWDFWQEGDVALHYRRRLSPNEIKKLKNILPSAPVFTHGRAMQAIATA